MMQKSLEIFDRKKDYLDSINVFPVPDGDTGINMYLTLKTIVEKLKGEPKEDVEGICEAISQGAFMGAKGNSGTILSQFIRGWINSLKKSGEITQRSFADALDAGKRKAYSAVMNPKEGTMLTVFRMVSEHANEISDKPWLDFIHEIFEVSQEATLKTREMMDVLSEGGVVDSGALGVVYILQGWAATIEEHVSSETVNEEIISGLEGLETHVDLDQVDEETGHRYCTEALIKSQTSVNELKDQFADQGTYFMLTESGGLVKLHIHTDSPIAVIRNFASYGTIEHVKVDDMISQAHYFREK